MNEYSQPGAGKISIHGDGVGAPTPQMVEKRAREIAEIDERDPNQFSDDDWQQARRELMGEGAGLHAPEEVEGATEQPEDHEMIPESHGHRAPRAGLDGDDETLGAQLVSGGVEEATHDQMLLARREELGMEGGQIEGA